MPNVTNASFFVMKHFSDEIRHYSLRYRYETESSGARKKYVSGIYAKRLGFWIPTSLTGEVRIPLAGAWDLLDAIQVRLRLQLISVTMHEDDTILNLLHFQFRFHLITFEFYKLPKIITPKRCSVCSSTNLKVKVENKFFSVLEKLKDISIVINIP